MAALIRKVRAFVTSSSMRRRLAIEAGWQLLRARCATLRSASYYTRQLGTLNGADHPTDCAGLHMAREIGHVVGVAARVVPFRALCLQQVIAVRQMLDRRGIPSVVFLGMQKDATLRSGDEPAHAWVSVAGRVVNGDLMLDQYVVVGRFA